MIPPVPLALRLALSAVCILISKAGFALAGWISPELTGADIGIPISKQRPKL